MKLVRSGWSLRASCPAPRSLRERRQQFSQAACSVIHRKISAVKVLLSSPLYSEDTAVRNICALCPTVSVQIKHMSFVLDWGKMNAYFSFHPSLKTRFFFLHNWIMTSSMHERCCTYRSLALPAGQQRGQNVNAC